MQREVSANLFRRLDGIQSRPQSILDAGCGPGFALPEWTARYPNAHRVAFDLALPMLLVARDTGAAPDFVCGDINALPFAAGAFDLVWSNLALQWINELPRAFAELWRVLRPGGLLSFTTIGPATLPELRGAFLSADQHTHVSRFVEAGSIARMLATAGFADCIVEVEPFVLTYADGAAMVRDLQAIGATNATHGRPRGLTGRTRWRRMLEALDATRCRDGLIPATFEIIYVQAWKLEARRAAAPLFAGRGATRVPGQGDCERNSPR